MKITHHHSAAKAINIAQTQLQEILQVPEPKRLLLSGGSSMKILEGINWEQYSNLTIFPLDERMSSLASTNNSLQLQKLDVPVTAVVPESGQSLDEVAEEFSSILSSWQQHPQGITIAVMGMGEDGHIAGISPFPDDPQRFDQLFVETQEIVVGYQGNLNPPDRITPTFRFLWKHVNQVIGYAVGKKKRQILDSLEETDTPLHQLPAVGLCRMTAEIHFHTTQ